jgi:hypothetical protein
MSLHVGIALVLTAGTGFATVEREPDQQRTDAYLLHLARLCDGDPCPELDALSAGGEVEAVVGLLRAGPSERTLGLDDTALTRAALAGNIMVRGFVAPGPHDPDRRWLHVTEAVRLERFLLRATGLLCDTAPCPYFELRPGEEAAPIPVSSVNLFALAAPPDKLERIHERLLATTAAFVPVIGFLFQGSEEDWKPFGRGTQFFPVAVLEP